MTTEAKDSAERWFYWMSTLGVLLGGIFWLSNLNYQSQANTDDVKNLKMKAEMTGSQFEEIRIRLTHIEDSLRIHRK